MAVGAADRGGMRASHADREQVIEALKDAFVYGRLTKDELDARAGQSLTARTRADLAALTADIPAVAGPARPVRPVRPADPARRRPLARAAVTSGICLIVAAAATGVAFLFGPPLMFALAACALWAGIGIMACAVLTSWDERSSRRQLPPRPGPRDLGAGAA